MIPVVDGRHSLAGEIAGRIPIYAMSSHNHLRGRFPGCCSGHLPPDAVSQARLPDVLRLMESIK